MNPEETVCPICFEPMENPRFLPCAHKFHRECIEPWLSERPSCPTCKVSIYVEVDLANPGHVAPEYVNPPQHSANPGWEVLGLGPRYIMGTRLTDLIGFVGAANFEDASQSAISIRMMSDLMYMLDAYSSRPNGSGDYSEGPPPPDPSD